jgi:hypothetical protein
MTATIRIAKWDRYQHYRDRNPPWIKLHVELLSSRTWVALDDASRALVIACMLIAAKNDGEVPADPAYLQRVAYLNGPPNLKPLIDVGFLEPVGVTLADASTLLADASGLQADARPETEAEPTADESFALDGGETPAQRHPKQKKLPLPKYTARDLLDDWNAICVPVGLLEVTSLGRARFGKALEIAKDIGTRDKGQEVLARLAASPFLTGRNKNEWRATFDWLCKDDSVWRSILEGKYDDNRGTASPHKKGESGDDYDSKFRL